MGEDVPAILFFIPLRLMDLCMTTTSLKTSPGVSWWRSGLSARLLPGHNCSHWRNQELSPAWETDHIVCKQNLVQQGSSALHVVNLCLSPFLRCSTLKAMYSPYGGQKRLLQITSSVHIALQKLLAFVFLEYTAIHILWVCIFLCPVGMKLSPYGLSAKSLLILLRTFVLVRTR